MGFMIRAVVFDLDGVVRHFDPEHVLANVAMGSRRAAPMTSWRLAVLMFLIPALAGTENFLCHTRPVTSETGSRVPSSVGCALAVAVYIRLAGDCGERFEYRDVMARGMHHPVAEHDESRGD